MHRSTPNTARLPALKMISADTDRFGDRFHGLALRSEDSASRLTVRDGS